MGFSFFAQRNVPNGYIKGGVAYTPAQRVNGNAHGVNVLQFPIVLSISFL
jgi:hypothetical protein